MNRLALFALFLAAALPPGPAHASDLDLEPSDDGVEIHGFVSQGFIKSTGNNYLARSKRGSFEFNEVGINFTKDLGERLRTGVQLFARDLGAMGNYNARFDWFYLSYRFADWLGIRAGRTKLPFGLYNESADVDAARVPILLPQAVYPTINRDILLAQTGLELYGYIAMGPAGGLEYRLYGGTISVDPPQVAPPLRLVDFDVPYMVGGRLLWETPLPGLRVGGSLQSLRFDTSYGLTPGTPPVFMGLAKIGLPFVLWLGSFEYVYGRFSLAGEYGRWRANLESNVPALLPPNKTVNERYYGMATVQVTQWLSTGAYYSGFFPKVEDRKGRDAYQHDFAGTLRFDLNRHWLLKLEGHFIHGTADLSPALNDDKPLNQLQKNWWLFLAKTTAYF
jgi:hypothetical protein